VASGEFILLGDGDVTTAELESDKDPTAETHEQFMTLKVKTSTTVRVTQAVVCGSGCVLRCARGCSSGLTTVRCGCCRLLRSARPSQARCGSCACCPRMRPMVPSAFASSVSSVGGTWYSLSTLYPHCVLWYRASQTAFAARPFSRTRSCSRTRASTSASTRTPSSRFRFCPSRR
jgi:hypothetical protein